MPGEPVQDAPDGPRARDGAHSGPEQSVVVVLDEVVRLVEQARAVPLSSSAVVDRTDLLALLGRLRAALPPALQQAEDVLRERDAVVEQGRAEAARLVARARAERDRLLAGTDLHAEAAAEADRLVEQAREDARALQLEVDDYVDAKLATFEVVLHKTLAAVERGRARLAGRSELDELTGDEPRRPGSPFR